MYLFNPKNQRFNFEIILITMRRISLTVLYRSSAHALTDARRRVHERLRMEEISWISRVRFQSPCPLLTFYKCRQSDISFGTLVIYFAGAPLFLFIIHP